VDASLHYPVVGCGGKTFPVMNPAGDLSNCTTVTAGPFATRERGERGRDMMGWRGREAHVTIIHLSLSLKQVV